MTSAISQMTAFDPHAEDGNAVNVIIETPKGSRNKFKYDDKRGLFTLKKVLPAGSVFPFDFGFVPGTRGEDGDPLDVLVLMDEPAFAGCYILARLIGVIEAEQSEKGGKTERNDRLIAVATHSYTHRDVQALQDLGESLTADIEHFFVSYNQAEGREFKPTGRFGPDRARVLVEKGVKASKKSR